MTKKNHTTNDYWILSIYLPSLKRKVKYNKMRYLIQHMGVSFDGICLQNLQQTNIEKTIKEQLDAKGIYTRKLINIFDNVWVAITKDKLKTFRYFINLYSPWFEEGEVVDFYNIQIDEEETIDVCTYVLDTCDNHHIFNHHLKQYQISYDDKKITLYEILEYLVDL